MDELVGNVGGSLSSARAPLLRAMSRTRPRVMAYAIQWETPMVQPGTYIDSSFSSAMGVRCRRSVEATWAERDWETSRVKN